MKKILTFVAIAGSLVACKQNKSATTDQTRVLSATDSAEFKQWKESKEKATEKTVVYKTESDAPVSVVAPVETKKKGWSKAAKGAVIGGATGAVAGAIISKNKAAGAVVGGVVGAGVGYGIGRHKDKKDGRY